MSETSSRETSSWETSSWETSSQDELQQSRKPPAALVLYNRPQDGSGRIRVEPEDKRLLKQVLNWAGYQTELVDVDDDVDRISDSVVLYKPTVIFNLVEHMFGDARQAPAVAGILDLFGYVYTGSGPGVLLDCLCWERVQLLLEHAGLPLSHGRPNRAVHACLLGDQDEVEVLPLVEEIVLEGEPTLEPSSLTASVSARVNHLCRQVWAALGLRDIGQVDFDVSPAGRVSVTGVSATVNLFGPVFRAAAAGREGGLPSAIVSLSQICHARLSPEDLLVQPLP